MTEPLDTRSRSEADATMKAVETTNPRWRIFHQDRSLTIRRLPLFAKTDRFFTIGSCFAEEVRRALTDRGIRCLPDYRSIGFDKARVRIDTLPKREHMNYYNTFSIVQEMERAAGLWTQEGDDLWVLPNRVLKKDGICRGEGVVYQDPYRRLVFALSESELQEAISAINAVVLEGLKSASVVVMTLGMTEVFINRRSGKVANQIPLYYEGGGEKETMFHPGTFSENVSNLERCVELLADINPAAKIVMTVSPVPLERTFTCDDVVVANLHSKSLLLSAARQVCGRHPHCYYFPSYEFVSLRGANGYLAKDGRHVEPSVVGEIIDAFMEATFAG